MASVVSIQIKVDDAGASEAINKVQAALHETGMQGEASLRQVGDQLEHVGGHVSTDLDKVRLLSQEFGMRLPRALESMISRMPMVTSAIGSLTGVLAGVAIAEVFTRGANALYNLEQRYVSTTAAADKYYETLRKTSELDFTNTRDLETTRMRLDQATAGAAGLPQAAQSMSKRGWGELLTGNFAAGIGEIAGAHVTAESGATDAKNMVELTAKQNDQLHEQALATIELAHAKDALLSKNQQARAEAQKQIAIDAENRQYNRKQEMFYGNPAPGAAGAVEQQAKDAEALAQAQVKLQDEAAQQTSAIAKARADAAEAGLQGEALYAEKLKDSVQQLYLELAAQRELGEFGARKAALEAQYAAEARARVRDLTQETQKLTQETAAAGLTGAARIVADRNAQTSDIDARQKKYSGGAALSPEVQGDFNQQRADAAAAANQKITQLEDTFTEHVKSLAQERTDVALNGYQRIDAEAQRSVDELKKLYDDDFADAELSNAQKLQASQALAAGERAIQQSAAAQRSQLAARNRAEDLEYAQQAATAEAHVRAQGAGAMVGAYRNAMIEIAAQEQERLAKLDEDAQKEGLTWQEAAQRRADIEREANAEVAEQNEQLVHALAGQLQSAFDNPMQFLKQKAEQAMFEIIANWMMQTSLFKSFFGNTLGGLQPGGTSAPGTSGASAGMSGVLRRVFGMTGAPAGTGGVISGGTSLPASMGGGGYSGTASMGGGASYSNTVPSPGYVSMGGGSTSSPDLVGFPDMSGISGVSAGTSAAAANASGYSGTSSATGMPATGGAGASGAGVATHKTESTASAILGAPASVLSSLGISPHQQQAGQSGSPMQSTAGGVTAGSATSAVMGTGTAALAGYEGAEGVLDSFHQGGVGGAVHGLESGAALGASIGSIVPGLGTAIGGIVGAAAGLATNLTGDILGEGGRFAARDYYKKTLYPQLEGVRKDFMNDGGGDYLSAVSEANQDAAKGMDYMSRKWGSSAAQWVDQNYLAKELTYVTATIERLARSGAQYTGRAAAEFHTGGIIGGFGDLGTTSTEGYIHAQIGEGITNVPATQMHGAAISLMNAGATPADMASHYLQASGASTRSPAASGAGGGDVHVHTLDTKTMTTWLRNGGAQMITQAQNRRLATYAGSSSNG